LRQELALAMLEDVLAALAEARAGRPYAGHHRSRGDAARRALWRRMLDRGRRDGHTGAVTAAARRLAREGRGGMLTLPGDIPLVTPPRSSACSPRTAGALLHDRAVA
jgi:2-phospho-L-lactate guanylyltransferase